MIINPEALTTKVYGSLTELQGFIHSFYIKSAL